MSDPLTDQLKLAGYLGPDQYVEPVPFCSAGGLSLFWVRAYSAGSMDLRDGVVLERGGSAVYVRTAELPVLSDVISGIVSRDKLT